jgi:nucleotidyltransferase substrate binding protein (TIGR01987 family)
MILDVTSLEKAIDSLRRGIDRSLGAPGDEELRDAVIQRFEFTMDLSWKFIQRFLKVAGIPDSEIRTKRDLFREGARLGLIEAPEKWFAFYEARNETSHTYNPEVADRVYHEALEFYPEAIWLLQELKEEAEND